MSSTRDRSPDRKRRRKEFASNDCKVFISNFPYEVKWQEIKDLFREKVGDIAHVRLYDNEQGKPRGCGLLEFATASLAKEAIAKMDQLEWKGRKLSVQEAADVERDEYGRIIKPDRGRAASSRHERRVYISNLPYDMKWQEVKDFFREKIGDVSYVELFDNEDGKPRGCGILEFSSKENAKKAIDLFHRYELKGRKISVQEAGDFERDKHGYIVKDGGRSREMDRSMERDHHHHSSPPSGGYGYTYGLSIDFLKDLGIDGPLHTKIYAGNLSYDVDSDKLKEVFRLAGKIVSAEVMRDRDGKSRGYGVIEFAHPVEAVQAISMLNNQKLYDRALHVRFDREPPPEDRLPRLLPEGLSGVGMGLGAGGKPLTNVIKTLEQAKDTAKDSNGTSQQPNNSAIDVSSVKVLAELTPALAMLAQQINIAQSNNRPHSPPPTSSLLGTSGNFSNSVAYPSNVAQSQLAATHGGNRLNPFGPLAMNTTSSMGSRGGNDDGYGSTVDYPGGYSGGSSLDRGQRDPYGGVTGSGAMMSQTPPSSQPFDTIIVRNLPHDIDWKELGEFFSNCGDVKNVMIKEKGVGLIRFTSQRAAERALNFDSTTKWGRLLDVRIY